MGPLLAHKYLATRKTMNLADSSFQTQISGSNMYLGTLANMTELIIRSRGGDLEKQGTARILTNSDNSSRVTNNGKQEDQ